MRKTVLAFMLFLSMIWWFSCLLQADITTDFKETLLIKVQEIKGKLFDLQRAVHEDLGGNLITAEYWTERAYLEVKSTRDLLTQTASITAKIDNAISSKDLALRSVQTGGSVLKAKIALQEVITDTGTLISTATQTPSQKITPAEASELQSSYIEPMLADLAYKDQLLLYIDYLLEEVNKRLSDAKAAVAEGNRHRARTNLLLAKSKLRWALSRVWQIKWNLITLIHRVYDFARAIIVAPVKASGLGLEERPIPLELKGLKLLSSPDRITFTALGRGIAAMQIQVFNLGGARIYSSPFVAGNTLEWVPIDNHGKPLANGVYLYVVTVRGWDGRVIHSRVSKLVILRP